jgi:hypothetical protein
MDTTVNHCEYVGSTISALVVPDGSDSDEEPPTIST